MPYNTYAYSAFCLINTPSPHGSTGEKWLYYDDPHIAPAAWFILAVCNDNPYVID